MLLTEAQIVAKVRAGSGQVGAGRGGADRAVLLRGQTWGRLNDPRQWRPPWTTREPSSGECNPRPPASGVLRLSPFPLLPRSSCVPSHSHSVRSLEPPSSSSLAHPIPPLPSVRRLWSPTSPNRLYCSHPHQPVPTGSAAPRFLPQRAIGARWVTPEVRRSPLNVIVMNTVEEAAYLLQLLRTMVTNLNDVSMPRGQASLGPGSENRVGVQGERPSLDSWGECGLYLPRGGWAHQVCEGSFGS